MDLANLQVRRHLLANSTTYLGNTTFNASACGMWHPKDSRNIWLHKRATDNAEVQPMVVQLVGRVSPDANFLGTAGNFTARHNFRPTSTKQTAILGEASSPVFASDWNTTVKSIKAIVSLLTGKPDGDVDYLWFNMNTNSTSPFLKFGDHLLRKLEAGEEADDFPIDFVPENHETRAEWTAVSKTHTRINIDVVDHEGTSITDPDNIKSTVAGSLVHLSGIFRAWKFGNAKKWGVVLDVENIQILRPANYEQTPKQVTSQRPPHGIIGAIDSLQKSANVDIVLQHMHTEGPLISSIIDDNMKHVDNSNSEKHQVPDHGKTTSHVHHVADDRKELTPSQTTCGTNTVPRDIESNQTFLPCPGGSAPSTSNIESAQHHPRLSFILKPKPDGGVKRKRDDECPNVPKKVAKHL
ncbi:hypothetical protein BDP27DRAFT_1344890, partial [Rhodocollybia butyracea]